MMIFSLGKRGGKNTLPPSPLGQKLPPIRVEGHPSNILTKFGQDRSHRLKVMEMSPKKDRKVNHSLSQSLNPAHGSLLEVLFGPKNRKNLLSYRLRYLEKVTSGHPIILKLFII